MDTVAEGENQVTDFDEDLLEFAARLRRERDERIAKIRETDFEVEPSPHLKELIDTQEEFRERVRGHLAKILS
jgi:hypothetical protein